MKLHLKVKICTLAAESKIIRQQQQRLVHRVKMPFQVNLVLSKEDWERLLPDMRENIRKEARQRRIVRAIYRSCVAPIKTGEPWTSLNDYRRLVVRWQARHALLAYGFMRGKDYIQLEPICYSWPNWGKILSNIIRFSPNEDMRIIYQKFEEWKQNGQANAKNLNNQNSQSNGIQAA
jgi:hypothetical protein